MIGLTLGCQTGTPPPVKAASVEKAASPGEAQDAAVTMRLNRYSANALLQELQARGSTNKDASIHADEFLRGLDIDVLRQQYEFQIKSIYGEDNRVDPADMAAAHFDPQTIARVASAADGIVAVFKRADLKDDLNNQPQKPLSGTYSIQNNRLYGTAYRLCDEERFRNQPSACYCSGALIGADLILTAGHCVGGPGMELSQICFVFGFQVQADGSTRAVFPKSDVYFGTKVEGDVQEPGNSDWALVRLDRPVERHTIQVVALFDPKSTDPQLQKIADGESVFTLGHPCGLPVKYAGGATVLDNTPACCFLTNLDTYGGNSGSPVFRVSNGTTQVVGVLVRGLTDFDFYPSGKCWKSARYRVDQYGEACTRSSEFASHLK